MKAVLKAGILPGLAVVAGCAATPPDRTFGDSVRQVTAAQTANPAGTKGSAGGADAAVVGNAVKALREESSERGAADAGVSITAAAGGGGRR